jgi:hypothetical protein
LLYAENLMQLYLFLIVLRNKEINMQINLKISNKVKDKLLKTQEQLNLNNFDELIKLSLQLLERAVEKQDQGFTIYAISKDDSKEGEKVELLKL